MRNDSHQLTGTRQAETDGCSSRVNSSKDDFLEQRSQAADHFYTAGDEEEDTLNESQRLEGARVAVVPVSVEEACGGEEEVNF